MKNNFIVFVLGLLTSSLSSATTLSPIQLLNPAGSTAGQAIVSTGPTNAPAWGNVSISTLIGVLPIANGGTGQTTAAAALTALGGLSTATAVSTYATLNNAALTGVPTSATTPPAADASTKIPNTNWVAAYFLTPSAGNTLYAPITGSAVYGAKTSPLSQFAATTSAQLAGVLSDETGTGSAVFGTAPTISTPNILGVTNGSAAAAGSIGEQPTASNSTTPMTTATAVNATSKALTAGQYLVWCTAQFVPAATTTVSLYAVGISTTSATRPGAYANEALYQLSFTTGQAQQLASPVVPMNVSTSTTAYCTAYASFGVSTMTVSGTINALRVR